MRKLLMLILVIGLSSYANAAWEAIGPEGGYLRTLVVLPTNGDIMYVGSYSTPTKVAKSTDAGDTWNQVGTIPGYTYCMAIDPVDSDILYASRYLNVYKSTDGGATWVSHSTTGRYIYGLAVHPLTPSTVFAAGNAYVSSTYMMSCFKSTDSGVNWSYVTLNSNRSYGYCLAIAPSDPNVIYVGGYYYHPIDSINVPVVYKSTDGGTNFIEVANGLPTTTYDYVYSIGVHSTDPDIVYAGLYRGVYRSTDGGGTWVRVSTHYYNYAMATSLADPDVAFVGGYSDMYKTTNAGATWFSSTTGLSGYYYRGLATSPSQATDAYTANNRGFYKSTSGGSNWYASNSGLNLGLPVVDATVAPSAPLTVYAQIEDIGVYKTTDCGSVWTLCPSFSSCGDMCALAVKNDDPDYVMAIEGSG